MQPEPEPGVARSRRRHGFADDALGDHDAVGLVGLLQAGDVSSSELVEAAIARAERLDPDLAAIAYRDFDRALVGSRHPRPGFFSGVPTLVKDNSDLAGTPTQQGTTAYAARPAAADGDFARMFLATGVVALGKSQLSEFGFSASAEFPAGSGLAAVRNPWDPAYSSGASSAGSSAFVAAGVVPLAHANDGGGSIRIPASCCGLVGLKPTRGRTPSDRTLRRMPIRLVADGVVTRSVRDTAAFLREAEKIYRDLALPPVGDVRGPGRRRLRIGLVTASLGGRRIDAGCVGAVEDLARLLEGEGHHVEPVDPPVPPDFADDFVLYWATLAAYLSDTGRLTLGRDFDRRRTDHLTRGLTRAAHRGAWRLPAAVRRLSATAKVSADFHARHGYDVLLAPTLAAPPLRIGELDPDQPYEQLLERLLAWVAFTPWQNATGEPAVSLPTGRSTAGPDTGLPIGVMASAPQGGEATLLELAYEVEALVPFRRIQDDG